MERQIVFCEIDFYKHFINSYPKEVSPVEENISRTKIWIDFNSFLSKSDIHFDISASDFLTLTASNEFFLNLWKKSTNGECGIDFDETLFPKLCDFEKKIIENNACLESVHLSCESEQFCNEVENNYGVKVISITEIFNTENLFNVHIETIENGDKSHHNWNFLSRFKHPCNSLAFVDNFILRSEIIIKENLIPILDQLLPNSLKIPFHISIFAKNDFKNKEYFELIKKLLENLRPNLAFKLTIHQLHSEFHDRTVITNYLLLDSGSGFDLFSRNKAIHQTSITGYYTFSTSNLNINAPLKYQVIRKSLTKVFKNGCSTQYLTTFWGDKENRLFEN